MQEHTFGRVGVPYHLPRFDLSLEPRSRSPSRSSLDACTSSYTHSCIFPLGLLSKSLSTGCSSVPRLTY